MSHTEESFVPFSRLTPVTTWLGDSAISRENGPIGIRQVLGQLTDKKEATSSKQAPKRPSDEPCLQAALFLSSIFKWAENPWM